MCVKHKQNWNAEKIKTANRKQTGHSKKKHKEQKVNQINIYETKKTIKKW